MLAVYFSYRGATMAEATKPRSLDYISKGDSKRPRVPISGIVALIAAPIQFPWLWLVVMLAWDDRWHLDNGYGPSRQESYIYFIAAILPGMVGMCCGIYSIWIAGMSKRNICGVLGLGIFVGELFTLGIRMILYGS